jgi:hypothetical protein
MRSKIQSVRKFRAVRERRLSTISAGVYISGVNKGMGAPVAYA